MHQIVQDVHRKQAKQQAISGVNRKVDVQASVVQNIEGAQQSVSGVNLDEEMTAMLQYQHGYDAAARFLTAIDQTLDTLINSTGLVGRT